MKKHIFGFLLFGLIVGTSVFASAIFYLIRQPLPKLDDNNFNHTRYSSTVCYRNFNHSTERTPDSVKIVQAVFNDNTKQLDVDFITPSARNVDVQLIYMQQGIEKDKWEGAITNQNMILTPDSGYRATQSAKIPWIKPLKIDSMYIYLKPTNNDFSSILKVPVLIIPKK